MAIHVRHLCSESAQEVFLTAVPPAGDSATQASAMFAEAAAALREADARIVQERIILSAGAETAVVQARQAAYGDLDDGVVPAMLIGEPTCEGPIAGLQIHAAVGDASIEPLSVDGRSCGRLVQSGGVSMIAATGIFAPDAGSCTEQAEAMLDKADRLVQSGGSDMFRVGRTWMWLTKLLDWYDDFNAVRNAFFRGRGLLDKSKGHKLPASTGISLAPAEGGHCCMELVAFLDPGAIMKRHLAGGDQGSAFDYGSAFSRAVEARTLAGVTVYVSGTAAVDEAGDTEHLDDPTAQIADTIMHARAIVASAGCNDDNVVHAIMYCKTPEVERILREQFADVPWPQLIVVCDICRHDLLFEVELAACRPT